MRVLSEQSDMSSASKFPLEDLSQTALFQKINDICAAVDAVNSIEELFDISLKRTMGLFGVRRGSIFILNKNGSDLVLMTAQGMKGDEKKQLVKRMGEGIVGQVAQLKEPIIVDDISKDKRFINYKTRGSYRTPSFICTPLMIKDKLIGVINLADKESN